MRFMMLMIPNGAQAAEYNQASPGGVPSAESVAAMSKYNQALTKAGVLLALDGLHPPAAGARVAFSGGKPQYGRPFQRSEGSDRRLLDDPGEVESGGDRVGVAVPGFGQRSYRNPASIRNVGFPGGCPARCRVSADRVIVAPRPR